MAVKLDPWHVGKVCFLGDAAHAIFPFYGAGLNTGLEDISVLLDLLENHSLLTKLQKQKIEESPIS